MGQGSLLFHDPPQLLNILSTRKLLNFSTTLFAQPSYFVGQDVKPITIPTYRTPPYQSVIMGGDCQAHWTSFDPTYENSFSQSKSARLNLAQ